jgi:hypothetical protein
MIMSLKAFHVVFISASVLLAMGLGAWEMRAWWDGRRAMDLALGLISLAAGIGLVVYGRYFLKKLRNVSYL